jgi:hypothetical protein
MHDDALANAGAFRIERLLHDERPAMLALREDAARPDALEAKRETRIPVRRVRMRRMRMPMPDASICRDARQIG